MPPKHLIHSSSGFPLQGQWDSCAKPEPRPILPSVFFQQCLNTEGWEGQRDGISAAFLQAPSQGPAIPAQRPPQLQ